MKPIHIDSTPNFNSTFNSDTQSHVRTSARKQNKQQQQKQPNNPHHNQKQKQNENENEIETSRIESGIDDDHSSSDEMMIVIPNWIHHGGRPIYSLTLHPNQQRLVTCGDDQYIRIWSTNISYNIIYIYIIQISNIYSTMVLIFCYRDLTYIYNDSLDTQAGDRCVTELALPAIVNVVKFDQ
jgi:WD40 repeat protein